MKITTVSIDLAKSFVQVQAFDAAGHVNVRKALGRAKVVPFFAKLPRCLVGMEACGTATTGPGNSWASATTCS